MEEFKKYAAPANTIKIEDITSNIHNQTILHQLKDNDPTLRDLYINVEFNDDYNDYVPEKDEDMGWLGYYIGSSTMLQTLYFYVVPSFYTAPYNNNVSSFYSCLGHNKTISALVFNCNLIDGNIFRMLTPFFKNNHSLTTIELDDCEFGIEVVRQFSLAIGSCNQSLKRITISLSDDEVDDIQLDGDAVGMITTLKRQHPQLEEIGLRRLNIGRNECAVLSTLLCSSTRLQYLDLVNNNISFH